MRALVDFMNHGILPFTGREDLVERVVSFWRNSADGNMLQGMLLLGEAGAGKSRLLEEAAGRIARANGAVVHIKLFPESATSIVPLIARAIWRFSESHPHLAIEAEETPASVVAALRRLIHLRPTLVVFEDVHLLGQGGGAGGGVISIFGSILEALADEQVALLCLARPVELAIKGVLERHLVDEIELPRLDIDAVASIWLNLFGSSPAPEIAQIILDATGGNPLALRSALRGAIKVGAVVGEGGDRGGMSVGPERFREVVERSVELLSEGMAAHLTEDERRSAARVASLGEIVARESALAALDGNESMLEMLSFKGVLVEGGMLVEAFPGPSGTRPLLSFTHSLLHRRLAGAGAITQAELASILALDIPLYSVIPFSLLLEGEEPSEIDVQVVGRVIARVALICPFLNRSHDWELGDVVRRACSRLLEANADRFDPQELRRHRAMLLNARLYLLWRGDYDDVYASLVDELEKLTASSDDPVMVEHYLLAHLHRTRLLRRRDYRACGPVWRSACDLVAAHPFLIGTMAWVQFLVEVATSARTTSDVDRMREVETRYRQILESDISEGTRIGARHAIFPYLADLFDTPEEAAERLATIDELMAEHRRDDRLFSMKALIRNSMGWMDEASDVVRKELIPRFRASGLLYNVLQSHIVLLQVDSAHGRPLDQIEADGERIIREAPAGMQVLLRQTVGIHLPYEGLLRGNPAWAARVYHRFLGEEAKVSSTLPFLIDLALGDYDSALARDVSFNDRAHALRCLVDAVAGKGSRERILEHAEDVLSAPLLRTVDLGMRRVALGILAGTKEKELRRLIVPSLMEMLEWLNARSLGVYMESALEEHADLLPPADAAKWRSEVARIARGRERALVAREGTGRIRVSMLGAISVRQSDGEVSSPRGIRVKTLLGLMVADRILETPLSHREFCRLVAPEASEFEDARKSLNLAVHRLRESIGHQAILTDRDTPRLDPDLVEIDLVQVHELLNQATRGVREGSYPRAFAGLMEALERIGGDVPFPTLYDDFFEAAREDFESRLRTIVLLVARGLGREGDVAGAAQILNRAVIAMPGDEEISLALAESLAQLGRRTEAERIRMEVAG